MHEYLPTCACSGAQEFSFSTQNEYFAMRNEHSSAPRGIVKTSKTPENGLKPFVIFERGGKVDKPAFFFFFEILTVRTRSLTIKVQTPRKLVDGRKY